MVPDPLHPAVVHFPIALVVFLPIVALAALWAIRRGSAVRRIWAVPVVVAALLVGSAWVAIRTGEAEEERVEKVVSEAALHEHEEAAERFLVLSGVVFLVAVSGLAGGALGQAGRLLTTVGAVGLVIAGIQVGGAGGELVYRHGAASVYVAGQGTAELPAARAAHPEPDDD
jgi:uncharacterized membrane protein